MRFTFAEPGKRIFRICINGSCRIAGFGKQCGDVYHCEILGDVVGAKQWLCGTDMKNFTAVSHSHGSVLHASRITGARSIDSNGIETDVGKDRIVAHSVDFRHLALSTQHALAPGVAEYRLYQPEMFLRVATISFDGFLSRF